MVMLNTHDKVHLCSKNQSLVHVPDRLSCAEWEKNEKICGDLDYCLIMPASNLFTDTDRHVELCSCDDESDKPFQVC